MPGALVAGIVRHRDHRPAAGANVRLYLTETKADENGRFRIVLPWRTPFERLARDGDSIPLCAGLPGFAPAILADFGQRILREGDIDDVELVLPGPDLSISGRIVGADDSWEVELRDGTEIVPQIMPIHYAEHLSSRRTPHSVSPAMVEDDGSFIIDGLLDRTYVIEAWNPWDPVMVRSDPVPAGTHDLVLSLPVDAKQPLSGLVVNLEGHPLVRATLEVGLDIHVLFQGHHNSIMMPEAITGADGRFVFPYAPATHSRLLLSGNGVVPKTLRIDEVIGVKDLVIRVARTATVVFEAAEDVDPMPDTLEVLDEAGAPLPFYWSGGERVRVYGPRFSLHGMASATVLVSERARTIVALREGAVLGRYPVDPAPGSFSTVTYRSAVPEHR